VSRVRKVFARTLLAALVWAIAPITEAQPPIRIGASLSQTGVCAALGQNLLRGYQLCVKHTNDKGGVLGRKLELLVYDDGSDPATAVRLYDKLIIQDKVDLVLGPYGSPISEAVADVTEKHKMPMVAPIAATTSIYRKGRRFIFGMLPPSEVFLEGLIDLAAKRGLRTVALINVDELYARAQRHGVPSSWPGRRGFTSSSRKPTRWGTPTSPRSWVKCGQPTPMCWEAPPVSRTR
jgi:branched-chain amino acid transport system substrate-binding protein